MGGGGGGGGLHLVSSSLSGLSLNSFSLKTKCLVNNSVSVTQPGTGGEPNSLARPCSFEKIPSGMIDKSKFPWRVPLWFAVNVSQLSACWCPFCFFVAPAPQTSGVRPCNLVRYEKLRSCTSWSFKGQVLTKMKIQSLSAEQRFDGQSGEVS